MLKKQVDTDTAPPSAAANDAATEAKSKDPLDRFKRRLSRTIPLP